MAAARRLLARRELPLGRSDLPLCESTAARASHAGACQTASGRALGNDAGQNFIYVHLNRTIRLHDLDMIYIAGPGHGGPALVANTDLEGSYSEIYPDISQDEAGMKRLFKQFSFPGGISSHVAPTTPGSIHEGGELGYSLCHAFAAAFDNPGLIVACIVGDGEAETGPLATAWQSNKFLDPITDGGVPPILHLNGFKISNPTVLARVEHEELENFFRGCGWPPLFVEGEEPEETHRLMAATVEEAISQIHAIQKSAREQRSSATALADDRPQIPKGWDRAEGRRRPEDRRHISGAPRTQLVDAVHRHHVELLESWMKSYKPEELFDANGTLKAELAELAPKGSRRMVANPHANGGILLHDLLMPDFRDHAVSVPAPGAVSAQDTMVLGIPSRRDAPQRGQARTSASSVRTRRFRTCSAMSLRSPIANGTPAKSTMMKFSRLEGRVLDSRSASINARDGSRAIC